MAASSVSQPAQSQEAAAKSPTPNLSAVKPAWLTDLSFGLKEAYDDNVFLVSGVGANKQSSWITTVSPKAGINLVPLLGKDTCLQALTLAYAPEFIVFHDQTTESYIAHRVATALKGQVRAFSFNLENSVGFIDGSDTGHVWLPPDNVASAYAAAAIRERRDQIQDRSKVVFRYDWEDWFIRPTASFLYYDLGSVLKSVPGYYNFCDRYDVNGGFDLGYKVGKLGAFTLGYRYGHQFQQQYPAAIDPKQMSSSSEYERLLLGYEGKPWSWLTVSLQGGPDFRSYPGDTSTHLTPIEDKHPIKYYGEATLTADISSKDVLAFKYKQWQWLSSVGKLPIFESVYDLSYRRTLSKQLSIELGGRIQSSDYTSGNVASSLRDDWQFTVPVTLTYAVNSHFTASLGYSLDLGRNEQDNINNAIYREFDRQIITVGAQVKF